MGVSIYLLTFVLLVIGCYIVVAKKNIIKIIVGILILDYAVHLLLVLVGYRSTDTGGGGLAPILAEGQDPQVLGATAVDPLPQAMVLTSIVIGLGVTALMVALAIRLHEKYGTFDMNKIRRLRG
jgi:multicomponent Na+:H+ antiporter subunit C